MRPRLQLSPSRALAAALVALVVAGGPLLFGRALDALGAHTLALATLGGVAASGWLRARARRLEQASDARASAPGAAGAAGSTSDAPGASAPPPPPAAASCVCAGAGALEADALLPLGDPARLGEIPPLRGILGPHAHAISSALLLATAALAALALVRDDPRPLRLVPALVWAGLALIFLASIDEDASLMSRVVQVIDPLAPRFVAPYCRGLTRVFAALFAVNATGIAALALAGDARTWARFSGGGTWALLGATAIVELFVRKLLFRHYGEGPLDRWLARAFPAEATARGRRSVAYVRAMRTRLGMPLPGARPKPR